MPEFLAVHKKRPIIYYLIFVSFISYTLGDFFSLFGIKLSWIMTIASFPFVFFDIVFVKGKLDNGIKILWFFFFWLVYSVLLTICYNGISLVLSSNLSLVINVYIVFLFLAYGNTRSNAEFLAKAVFVGVGINIALGVCQMALPELRDPQWGNTPIGVYGNPNDFATVMIFGLLLSLYWAVTRRRWVHFMAAGLVLFVMTYFSTSRLALLCCIIVLPVYAVNCFIKTRFVRTSQRSRIYFWLITLLITLFLALLLYWPHFRLGIFKLLSFGNVTNIESDLYRLDIMKEMLRGALMGVGAQNSIAITGINAHFMLLEILTEYGIIFFTGFLLLLQFIACRENCSATLSAYLKTAVFLFFILGFLSSSMFRMRVAWLFLSFLLTISLQIVKKEYYGRNKN